MALSDEDARDVRQYQLTLEHETHHGQARYMGRPIVPSQGDPMYHSQRPSHFYRAMTYNEFDTFRMTGRFPRINGHQGWAPYCDYAKGYLGKHGTQFYSRLVEVFADGFIPAMNRQGWFTGKAEGGCVSWGIGATQSNGWRPVASGVPKTKNAATHPSDIFLDEIERFALVGLLST